MDTPLTPSDIDTLHLPPPRYLDGYRADEVDAFLAQVRAALSGGPVVTADDVTRVLFTTTGDGSGYDPEAVDELLDRLCQQFTEHGRTQ